MKSLRIIIVLLVILSLKALLFTETEAPTKSVLTEQQLHLDYYMENFYALEFSKEGKQQQTLFAKRADIEQSSGTSTLYQPEIVAHIDQATWLLSAQSAVTKNNHQQLDLTHQVQVQILSDEKPLKLETDQLAFDAQTHQLTSSSQVTLSEENGQISGTGLQANLKEEVFQLKNNVKGIRNNAQ